MHYDEKYFEWQREIGDIGGKVNLFIYEKFIKPSDVVIDFGCGGGFLLKNINCKEKLGIEINETARKCAKEYNNIDVVASIEEVPDAYADCIISNHALEHTFYPLKVIMQLQEKLKNGGKIILVVPFERDLYDYKKDDTHMHLYTWNKQTLGNLFKEAGYTVISVNEIKHLWPPRYSYIYKVFGSNIFYVLSKLWSFLNRNKSQLRIIAQK